jgi:hypothetical protein
MGTSSTTLRPKFGSFDWRSLEQQLLFLALVIGLPVGIATVPAIFRDGDVSWHVAAGNWILSNGQIPRTDPFSFTAAGHPWVATEWLSEVMSAAAFSLAGYAGLATLVAVAMIALNAIVFFHLQRRSAALPWAALLAMDVVLAPLIMARPHVLAWPLLAGWTVLLLSRSDNGRPPPLWAALILVVWTNLHTSFPLAAPIGAAFALDSLIAAQWKTLREWLLFGFVSLLAVCANANGIAGLLQPFHISRLEMVSVIGEWSPTTTHNTPEFFVILLIGLGLLLWRGVRIPVGRLALLLVTLGLAFMHMRHQSAFIILAACIVPPLIASTREARQLPLPFLVAALPFLIGRAIMPLTPPEGPANPRHLIAAIPDALKNQPVFNDYTMGGPLILAGIKPYIDGRGELYGDQFVLDYTKAVRGDFDRFNRAVERYDIRWTILAGKSPLAHEIDASGKWRRIYADDVGVIDVRIR